MNAIRHARCVIFLIVASAVVSIRGQGLPEGVLPTPEVFVANGGFDIGDAANHPIGWSVSGRVDGVKVINRKDDRTAGMASLEFESVKGSPVSIRSERAIAVVGGAYTLTANVKGKSGTPCSFAIEFWSFDGNRLGENHVTPEFKTEWQTVKVEATAPANSTHVVVVIEGAKEADGVTLIDEVELQLAPLPYDPTLGDKRELFLDDYRIASAYHVERVAHSAHTTTQPVIRPDKPWEASAYIYGTVLKMDGKFRMWYTAYSDIEPHYLTGYAESGDGLAWNKPSLGLVDYKGSKDNNLAGGGGSVTYNPDAPPDRRFAGIGFKQGIPTKTMGYFIFFSADGLKWRPASDKPALLDGDVANLCYDPVKKLYIATFKKRMFTSRTPGIYERSAFISTSTDAITWAEPQLAVMGDYADDGAIEASAGLEAQIYGMPVSRYENIYVGFPWVYYIHDYIHGDSARTGDGPVDVQIASSRELTRWARPLRKRIIEPGGPGSWNDGAHYTASNFLVDDEKITMYYGAFNNGHGGSDTKDPHRGKNVGQSGIATWRRDGWVSLTNASMEGLGNPGQVTTKPIVFDGKALHVNAVVHPGGTLKVELLDANGTAIPGFAADKAVAIEGDKLDAVVKWTGDPSLSEIAGKQVALRFTVVNADIYSYWVTK